MKTKPEPDAGPKKLDEPEPRVSCDADLLGGDPLDLGARDTTGLADGLGAIS